MMRAILDITAETLAITRESILASQEQLESQKRLEVVASHTDMGIHTILKTTSAILGITQRLEQYRSGRYTLLDEWLIFWIFFILHPLAPQAMELFGSCMLYVLTAYRIWNIVPISPSLYSYFTSPYKAIFLLYWFTDEYNRNPVSYQYAIEFPHIEPFILRAYDPTCVLITFARWIVVSVSRVLYSIGHSLFVGCFARQLNSYLVLELYAMRSCLYGVWYILSILFHGLFAGVCEVEFALPFYTLKPFYYIC